MLSSGSEYLLSLVNRPEARRFYTLTTEDGRRAMRKTQLAFQPEPVAAEVCDVAMARDDAPSLAARLYRPEKSGKDPLPVLIWFHGGGWCTGDLECADVLCRDLCHLSGNAVLSVDYRLAPEHPFPAAVMDCRFAFEWLRQHAAELALDGTRIVLGGDSAGGNLAIVTALALREQAARPRGLMLVYPSVEADSSSESMRRYGEGYLLDTGSLHWFYSRYVQDKRIEKSDWRLSPLRAASLSGLPPMLIVNGEYDPLTDDCTAFAARVKKEGGQVEQIIVPGVIHSYLTLGKLFPEAGQSIALMAERIRFYNE